MEPTLYKKKITTVVKEYYKILKDQDGIISSDSIKEVYGPESLYPPPGQAPIIDRETFISSIRSYFESYGRKMKDMIAASVGPQEQIDAAEENMFADIWAIAPLLRQVYPAEFAEKVLQSLRSIALLNLQIVDSARRSIDSKMWEDRLAPWPVNDLSYNFNSYNNLIDREQVRSFWLTATNSWISALKAKVNKDEAGFNQYISQADDALGSFSSMVSQAIINRNSGLFTPAA